jgi:hypothetical protein
MFDDIRTLRDRYHLHQCRLCWYPASVVIKIHIMSLPVSPYQCMNNPNQEIARTVVRKVSAVLSVSGSIYVLRLISIKWRGRKSSVDSYHRIMAGLCVYDITFAFVWWFMGSWMTPIETGWWGAVGNTHSCTAQGALTDFALIGIWVSLSIGRFASYLLPIIGFSSIISCACMSCSCLCSRIKRCCHYSCCS